MAENDNDFENENQNDNSNNSGKGLRAQLEAALAKISEQEKTLGELSSKTRAVDLAKFLKSAGARDGAEALYPESADVSEEAVKAWVEKNAAFVRDESGSEDEGQQQVSEQTRANSQRLAGLVDTDGGKASLGDPESIMRAMKEAKTPEELQAIYDTIGFVKV